MQFKNQNDALVYLINLYLEIKSLRSQCYNEDCDDIDLIYDISEFMALVKIIINSDLPIE